MAGESSVEQPHVDDGTIDEIAEIMTYRFSTLRVERKTATPIQLDGELVDCGADVEIKVLIVLGNDCTIEVFTNVSISDFCINPVFSRTLS